MYKRIKSSFREGKTYISLTSLPWKVYELMSLHDMQHFIFLCCGMWNFGSFGIVGFLYDLKHTKTTHITIKNKQNSSMLLAAMVLELECERYILRHGNWIWIPQGKKNEELEWHRLLLCIQMMFWEVWS